MIKLIIDKIPRIIKAKKQLEKELEVKISNRGKEVYLEGSAENEYDAEKVILAIDFGFPVFNALLIKKEELLFEVINIKEHTSSKDFERIRGRLIGKGGGCLKTLCGLTDCFLEIKGNEVGIIGRPESIQRAQDAVISIIRGSKHSNVYSRLEKLKPLPIVDLGLKKVKKN